MRAKSLRSLRLALPMLFAPLAVLGLSSPARAEEIPGSGCDPNLYQAACWSDNEEAKIYCGAQVAPEKTMALSVRVAAYDPATDAEIGRCVTTDDGDGVCDPGAPDAT